MTHSKTITVVVQPNGETKIETQGFTGRECLAASRFLESALGKQSSERLTAEFYQGHEVKQANQQHY